MPCAEIKEVSAWFGWGDTGSTVAEGEGEAAIGVVLGNSTELELGELQPVKKITVDKRVEPILRRECIKL